MEGNYISLSIRELWIINKRDTKDNQFDIMNLGPWHHFWYGHS